MIFETVSFHIVKPCNYSCKYCYATFNDMKVKQLELSEACNIIKKLCDAGIKKITFAGGEPMLYKYLNEVISFTKYFNNITTSIITNGSMLTHNSLMRFNGKLDWIGISVDSLSRETNLNIGRISGNEINYRDIAQRIKGYGFKLKINTVVNKFNYTEDLNEFIEIVKPDRWKVFQALKVEGQNEAQFDKIKVSDGEFRYFISRHIAQKSIVVENNEAMTGSYLLIDPQGRLFENSQGKHTYSDKLQNSTVEECLSQISLNRSRFISRGGIYNW